MFGRIIGLVLVFLIAWIVFVRPSSGSGPERRYVVRPHDTLWTIAASHYGGDPREGVWKLMHRNHLAETILRPGQRLVLP